MIDEQPEGAKNAAPGRPEAAPGPLMQTSGEMPALPVVLSIGTKTAEPGPEEQIVDEHLMRRIANLPKEAGWALITAGVIGVIAPGIMGWPFLVAGAFVLTPGGPPRLARWAGRKPRKYTHAALRQICRLIDDLERRYPSTRAGTPTVIVQHRRNLDVR